MTGPFVSKSFDFPRDVLLRSMAVRLLAPDGSPDPDQSRLCHVTLAHAKRTHIPGMAPQLFTLDLGARRVEMPRGYGLLLRGGERYLLNAMLTSDDPAGDREHLFEVTMELEDADGPGAPRPLVSVVVGLTADDAHEHHATAFYDWRVAPGARRPYVKRTTVPRDLVVRGISLHLHRYASAAAVRKAGGETLFSGPVRRSRDGRLEASPALVKGAPLRLRAGTEYEFAASYHNTGKSTAPVMGVFYLFADPPPET